MRFYHNTLAAEKVKSEDCVSLLKMVTHMKTKEFFKAKIFPKGYEPLFECLQSIQFKSKMFIVVDEGLKETEAKVKKDQDRDYELLRGLHMNSQNSGKGKGIIGITVMQTKFSNYIDSLIGISFDHQNRVSKLQKLGGCVHVAMEEIQDHLSVVKYLAREHYKWLLRYTNAHVNSNKELIPIIVAAKAYRTKVEKGKKAK